MAESVVVYVALLNEGTSVWRPVQAAPVGGDVFTLFGEIPDDEEWQFVPGQRVRCERKQLQGQANALVAVEESHV